MVARVEAALAAPQAVAAWGLAAQGPAGPGWSRGDEWTG